MCVCDGQRWASKNTAFINPHLIENIREPATALDDNTIHINKLHKCAAGRGQCGENIQRDDIGRGLLFGVLGQQEIDTDHIGHTTLPVERN